MSQSKNILGTMPMGRLIFTMSGPIMLSMLMQAVYNLVDSIYVARLGDNAFLALSYAYPIQTLLIAFCVGTGVAFSATLSQRLGARQMDQASAVVLHGGSFYFGCWLLFFLFGLLGADAYLRACTDTPSVITQGAAYLRVCCCLSFGVCTQFPCERILQSSGRPAGFMIIQGSGALINIILDPILIFVLDMGVRGAAIATVLSQCVSGFLTVRCLLTSQEMHVKELHFSGHIFKKMMNIGIPAGIQGSLFSISNFIIQASVNSFGAAVIAGNSACVSVEGLLYCPSDAVMQAATTAVSQNVGAQEYERSRSVARWSMVLVVVLTGILTVPAVVFRRQVLGLYTSSGAELQAAFTRMMIVCMTYSLDGTMAAMSGVNRGLGYSMLSAAVTFVGACVFRIIWVYTVFASVGTLESLYVSYPISWILSTAAHIVCYYIIRKKPFKATLEAKAAAA